MTIAKNIKKPPKAYLMTFKPKGYFRRFSLIITVCHAWIGYNDRRAVFRKL